MTAKRLLRDEESNALTTDCLGMVQTKVMPTPPCMAATLFQDAGVTYGCEADVFGAISLMFTSYLFDKPGFMNDPVPETVKNLLIASHCVSPTLLNGFDKPAEPYILRSHSESNIGVSLQVLWRESQPVTLVRFKSPNELIVDTGRVVANVDTPPAGGCRTSSKSPWTTWRTRATCSGSIRWSSTATIAATSRRFARCTASRPSIRRNTRPRSVRKRK